MVFHSIIPQPNNTNWESADASKISCEMPHSYRDNWQFTGYFPQHWAHAFFESKQRKFLVKCLKINQWGNFLWNASYYDVTGISLEISLNEKTKHVRTMWEYLIQFNVKRTSAQWHWPEYMIYLLQGGIKMCW